MAYFIRHNPSQTDIQPRWNSVIGHYPYSNPYRDENAGNVRVSWKVKGDTYGTRNHKEDTNYSSGWGQVEEQPLVARRYQVDSEGKVFLDVVDTFWMSRNLADPYAWSISDSLYARAGNNVNRVDTELLAKLSKRRDGVQAQFGASIGEARQTAELLSDVVIPPVKALIYLRKGNVEGALQELGIRRKYGTKSLANLWLEYQYGIVPLLNDVYSAHQVLSKKVAEPMTITVKHSRTVSESSSGDWGERETSVRNGIGVTCRYEPSILSNLDSMGLLNPLSVAWELVPFSFVVDWFIPIGNTLTSLTASADLHFERGYRNSLIKDKFIRYDNGHPGQIVQQRGRNEVNRGGFNRVPMSGFPTPKLYANENPFSTGRILNAVALLTQLFTGR
jgi:hypothetical protein